MMFKNQLIYSVTFVLALFVSACMALPINITSIDHATELMIGVLALICISITIVACACCHRNKSGFEEFENENTLADQTNSSSRSEFPIFRAISPQIVGQPINNADNNLDNRILSNIVNQNHMNRTFNEFENSQNNNGPISTVDLENIQNNNAVDYIPNRNEINITIEPSPHSINRNLLAEQQHQQQQMMNNESVPMTTNSHGNVINHNNYAPHLQTPFRIPPPSTSSDSAGASGGVGHIDRLKMDYATASTTELIQQKYFDVQLNEEWNSEYDSECIEESPCAKVSINDKLDREPCIQHDYVVKENESNDYDAISVEEALRALDFAISGGESLLSDYQDDNDDDDDDDDDVSDNDSEKDASEHDATETFEADELKMKIAPEQQQQQQLLINNDLTKTELNGANDAKDKFSLDNANIECCNSITDDDDDDDDTECSKKEVYELAKSLVDDVLEKCIQNVTLIKETPPSPPSPIDLDKCIESHMPIVQHCDTIIISDKIMDFTDLDDSLDETFIIGKLEASTPCHKTGADFQFEKKQINLFQTLNEVNESNLSTDGIGILQATQPVDATFEIDSNKMELAKTFIKDQTYITPTIDVNDQTITMDNKQNEKTFSTDDQANKINPIIKIDKEEIASEDLTTLTPMNTPIELNYVGESWDLFVSKSQNANNNADATTTATVASTMEKAQTLSTSDDEASTSANPWYLHAPSNTTYDMGDYSQYDANDEDSESIEENPELLSLTFDALRKQLADTLPHASVRPSVEYSDDDDNENSDSEHDNDSLERYEGLQSEVVINYYKQQLSPILEESEDETCKTFVLNETKCLDSTSTGCIETSEAIMGVTKVLMASNDTLFNFEDTLGDRDDMFSPRNSSNSGTLTANTPQPINCRTPTNEMYLNVGTTTTMDHRINDTSDDICRPTMLPLCFENPLNTMMNDLLSPEQQKTFSEEINTVEQLSSDLSGTIDATTNTLDDLKTCISVHLNDDTSYKMDEESEQTENIAIELVQNECDDTIIAEQPQPQQQINDKYADSVIPNEITDMNSVSPETIESAKENTNPNSTAVDTIDTDVKLNYAKIHDSNIYAAKNPVKTIVSTTMHENVSICEIDTQNEQNCLITPPDEFTGQLSGEEDPWASHPISDIRFNGPCSDVVRTSFASNDWDSDIEDSNSSEEFLYAKGESQMNEYLQSTQNNARTEQSNKNDQRRRNKQNNDESGDEQPDVHGIWNSHEDLIAVSTNADGDSVDDVLDESSISENEDEWVPSSWDSMAKPARSALKSPDKSSSKSGTKSRRNVVFKKQSYQSVYEYPKENAALSPTLSEPQSWSTYLANSSPYSSSVSDSYVNSSDSNGASYVDFNALDGFAVSSSSRPFHGSQFNAECHTWPTDSEFSWSQMQSRLQSDIETTNSDKTNYVSDPMDWQLKLSKGFNRPAEGTIEHKDLNHRPDSGVGESAELLSETVSLGDLRHTKASLRLPLNSYAIPTSTTVKEIILPPPSSADEQTEFKLNAQQQNDLSDNVLTSDSTDSIVPTSCTGSMDSINSFDGGKIQQQHQQQNHSTSTNTDGLLINDFKLNSSIEQNNIEMTDERQQIHRRHQHTMHNDITINTNNKKCDLRSTANRQSDSTDEDSGIENIVRISKEI